MSRLVRSRMQGDEVLIHVDGRLPSEADAGLAPAEAQRTDAAADIVDQARERADEMLRSSTAQATVAQQDAYRQGHEQGYREGTTIARAELAEALALVQRIALDAKVVRDRLLRDVERETIELVIASTRAVLGEQVQIDPALVLDTVQRALKRAGAQNIVRIRVHPQDHELVSARLGDHRDAAVVDWAVTADGSITVGGCVIDTEAGEVDARLDVQLEEVARRFRAAVQPADAGAGEAQADAA